MSTNVDFTNVFQIDREALAWAAGLFEGEGCFTAHQPNLDRRTRYAPMAQMCMTDEDVVRRFNAVVGLGTVSGPYKYGTNVKPFWKWSVTGLERVQALLAMFWPWLGTRRIARAIEVLAPAPTSRANARKTHCKRGHEFNAVNTYVNVRGARTCRPCARLCWAQAKLRRAAGRAAA